MKQSFEHAVATEQENDRIARERLLAEAYSDPDGRPLYDTGKQDFRTTEKSNYKGVNMASDISGRRLEVGAAVMLMGCVVSGIGPLQEDGSADVVVVTKDDPSISFTVNSKRLGCLNSADHETGSVLATDEGGDSQQATGEGGDSQQATGEGGGAQADGGNTGADPPVPPSSDALGG